MTAPRWEHAACVDADPERWFPGPNTPLRDIAAVVGAGCPVRIECLALALQHGERYGIWGGVTAEGRRARARRDAPTNAASGRKDAA